MAETVETAIYRLQVEGQAALGELKSHVDGLAIAQENATASTRKFSQGLQTSIARGDETVRALENIRKALVSYEGYAEEGKGTQQQLAAYYEITNQKVAAQTTKLEELAVATENARRAQANLAAGPGGAVGGAGGAASYEAEFNRMMTISEGKAAQIAQNFGRELDERMIAGTTKAAADSGRAMAAELDKLDKIAQLKAQQAGQNFQRSLNEYFGIDKSQAYVRGAAGRAGSAFGDVEPEGIVRANKSMEQLGNSTKVARYEMINLGRQAQDVVVSLGSGQNILVVGLQQGSQILDVFLSSERSAVDIIKGFGSAIGSFLINPITLAVGAVAALTATVLGLANAWDKAQKSSQMALSGAGRASGTTITDLNAFVEKNAAVGGTRLSGVEARELANALAATGKIVVRELDDMSDAVIGFAAKTKKSTAEASADMVKFATDPVKGLEELEKVYGAVDVKTRDAVKSMADADDKTGAFNLVLRATADEAANAAKNLTVLEQATRLLFSSREFGLKPTGIEDQVDVARKRVETLINQPTQRTDSGQAQAAEAMKRLNAEYERLFALQQKDLTGQMTQKMNEWAKALGIVQQSIIPQIKQIENLTTAIEAMEIAKQRGVTGPFGAEVDANALKIAKGMKEDLIESQAAAARVVDEVNKIADAYRGVSKEVAKQLYDLQLQTVLAGAVGAAEKQTAQYAIDNAAAKRAGASAEEATLIALQKQKATQAAIDAASKESVIQTTNSTQAIQRETEYIKEQTAIGRAMTGEQAAKLGLKQRELEDQAKINELMRQGVGAEQAAAQAAAERANSNAKVGQEVAERLNKAGQEIEMSKALTHADEMRIQFQRTYNDLRAKGVDAATAELVAQQEFLAEQETVNKSIYQEVKALENSTELIIAQKLGMGGMVMAAQAYDRAIDAGASSTAAVALSAATLVNELVKVGDAAQAISYAFGWEKTLAGFDVALQKADQLATALYNASGYGVYTGRRGSNFAQPGFQPRGGAGGGGSFETDPLGLLAIAKERAASPAWEGRDIGEGFRQQSADLERYGYNTDIIFGPEPRKKAADKVVDSIDKLTKSTDSLNKTNQDLLSPYYTQDPRTSHIGFRSQGMALGGYVDVPGGYSSNDNMIATIPVASGERIYIDPMNNRRATSSGSGTVINISSPINIFGNADKDSFGRTVYQANQQLAKSVRAATQ